MTSTIPDALVSRFAPAAAVRLLIAGLFFIWGAPAWPAAVAPSGVYWPDGVVPYTISASASADAAVHEDIINAIHHWEARSMVRFVPRTTEPDYVTFDIGTECDSDVGRTGAAGQPITLIAGGGCEFRGTVHLIGHALGYWDEHTRQDRDTYITYQYWNADPNYASFFEKYSSGSDLNEYDYGSVMHPGPKEHTITGFATLVPVAGPLNDYQATYGPTTIGQRLGLSVLDRLAANQMYDVCWDGPQAGGNYWQANAWSACSASCTDPGRTRSVFCHLDGDGSCTSDSSCEAGLKPATTDSCAALLDCDFDNGNCGWDPMDTGDQFDWLASFTSTPTPGTGPSADHTSGAGFYLYIETSDQATGDAAFLTSVPVDIAAGTTLSFWYHFNGYNIGSLNVEVAACGGSWTTLLTISSANTTLEDAWREASVELPAMSNSRIRFKATRGSAWSDIAIDDVSLSVASGPPPKATLVDSVNDTGDGELAEAESVDVSLTQLLVTFDVDMADPAGDGGGNDVTNPANYLLYEYGVNGVPDSSSCAGGVVSDDVQLTVDSVTYNPSTLTATLNVNGGGAIPGGTYRLHACASLKNTSGDNLDGNGDGTPGDDFLRTFSILDFDGDGSPDGEDPDDDNDSVNDSEDAFPYDPNEWADSDNDGTGDNADTDDDNDGVLDVDDAFPFDPSESVDTDGDGIGNNADTDDDNDGLSDDFETANNLDPLDGTDCPPWVCPLGAISGWRVIMQSTGP